MTEARASSGKMRPPSGKQSSVPVIEETETGIRKTSARTNNAQPVAGKAADQAETSSETKNIKGENDIGSNGVSDNDDSPECSSHEG
ncbi:unnamed protein product [Rotaria magnacalcarata]|uniref:Uncharacterized protein n=1 Tax=Rotaria magnacalcarata TaxID=392030 RepID=A0A8S3H2W1_9BILA|nr:unnamed protein product [Rotaria magnacalcarata]